MSICSRLHQTLFYKLSPLIFMKVLCEGKFRDSLTKKEKKAQRD